ncbi:MAG: response regulator [Firmicutes bacterium]|nr:response regulator [Bacillota bacterium]
MEQTFYICRQCGAVTHMLNNSGVPVICCGQKMETVPEESIDDSLKSRLGDDKNLKFYYCEDCDNVVAILKDSGVPLECCGHFMEEIRSGEKKENLETGGLASLKKDEKMSAEEKIRSLLKQKQLLTMLVNGTIDMFMMFSAEDFKAEYISPNMEYLLGMSLEEVRSDVRRFFSTAVDTTQWPDTDKLMSIPLGGSLQMINEHINPKTQERRWYHKDIYHFYLEGEHKFIMVISDRTKEKEIQKQLEISIEMTRSANEAKSSFLANMSHDIRTPMNAIVGLATLLKHDAENPAKVLEYARKISSSSQHLLNLINDILDMSKIESGKATIHMEEFDLSQMIEDINVVVQPQAKAKQQEFKVITKNITCDRLKGDKTRINQILLNLLSNSVKYTPDEGRIQLILTQLGQADGRNANLQFKVIDNGMGMSPEYLEVIFDAFTREENAAVRKIQGTGLGMAITKNLVELMGGSISVKSKQGEGSEFTVNLPLASAMLDKDKEFWEDNNIKKILVVCSDETVGNDIKNVMSQTGVIVAHTDSGEQAVKFICGGAAVGQPFDLVLMDWRLTDMTAAGLSTKVSGKMGADVPEMILCDYDWSQIEEEAMEAGIKGFLQKPFFVSSFRALIEQLRGIETAIEESSGASLAGIRFLVAEDNELNAEILSYLLELEEATCELAENGEIAVRMLRDSEPGYYDMILMDVQMPVMDGYAATGAIRALDHPDAKKIPIAAMTANAFEEDVQNALNAGMDAHVAKPVDMDVLKETVARLMQK